MARRPARVSQNVWTIVGVDEWLAEVWELQTFGGFVVPVGFTRVAVIRRAA